MTEELLEMEHYFRALQISHGPSFQPDPVNSLTKAPLTSPDKTNLCRLTHSAYCCCGLAFVVNYGGLAEQVG